MAKVLLDMAISLDGFVGGPDGADVGLYDWYFNPSEVSRPVITELVETTGAIVIGRGAFGTGEDAEGWDDTPYAVPHFVITHHPPAPVPGRRVEFIFMTDGTAAAVEAAKEAAGDRYGLSEAVPTSRDKPWRLGWSMSCSCILSRSWLEMESGFSTVLIMAGSCPGLG